MKTGKALLLAGALAFLTAAPSRAALQGGHPPSPDVNAAMQGGHPPSPDVFVALQGGHPPSPDVNAAMQGGHPPSPDVFVALQGGRPPSPDVNTLCKADIHRAQTCLWRCKVVTRPALM